MSTTEQKALELADRLQQDFNSEYINWDNVIESSAELRRLSAENEALSADLEAERAAFKTCAQERYNYHANLVDMRYQLTAVTNERDALRAQVEALTKPQEPVMIYHGGCTIDCGEHGHHNMEMLKLIPAGTKLYAHPSPSPLTRPAVDDQEIDRVINRLESDDPDFEDCSAAASLLTKLKSLTRPAVPEGWRLVPFEPTVNMNRAGYYAHQSTGLTGEIWRAMLAVAPQPEVEIPDHVSEAQAAVARNLEVYHRVADRRRAATTHPDDAAIDCFAGEALKPKMAEGRAKGRSGWETCPPEVLSRMLREHVEKGDPRDVALFCMMLWNLEAGISSATRHKVDDLEIKNASLESEVWHLSTLCDVQRAILIDVEKEFGTDAHGIEFEDGDSKLIDRVRAHLAMLAQPKPPVEVAGQAAAIAQEALGYVRECATAWEHENLRDCINRLAALAAPQPGVQPTEAAQPDPCPGCTPSSFCKKPTCGRLLALQKGGA